MLVIPEGFSLEDYLLSRDMAKRVGSATLTECLWHKDNRPSLQVNDEYVFCHSCGKHAFADQYLAQLGITRVLVDDSVRRVRPRKPSTRTMDLGFLGTMHKTLLNMPSKIEYLLSRGITYDSIEQKMLGYGRDLRMRMPKPRFSFPFFDCNKNIIGVKYRSDPAFEEEDRDEKYLSAVGASVTMYGLESYDPLTDKVMYTSGQIDQIVLQQMDYNVIASPGEGTFKEEWRSTIKNSEWFVVLDNDIPGVKSTIKICKRFPDAIPVFWPRHIKSKDMAEAVTSGELTKDKIDRMLEYAKKTHICL